MNAAITTYLEKLSDTELVEKLKVAVHNLEATSDENLNTPWNDACFAGACFYSKEATKRGLGVGK